MADRSLIAVVTCYSMKDGCSVLQLSPALQITRETITGKLLQKCDERHSFVIK